jgi:hypothetical protein
MSAVLGRHQRLFKGRFIAHPMRAAEFLNGLLVQIENFFGSRKEQLRFLLFS